MSSRPHPSRPAEILRTLLALCAAGGLGCAAEVGSDSSDAVGSTESPIIDGDAADVPSSVRITINQWGQSEPEYCSGTLLTNDIVLTARHCVAQSLDRPCGALVSPYSLSVHRDLGWDHLDRRYPSADASVTEIEVMDESTSCTDLALLRLNRPISFSDTGNGRPANIAGRSTQLVSASAPDDLVGQDLRWVGHGERNCSLYFGDGTDRPQVANVPVDFVDDTDILRQAPHRLVAPFLAYVAGANDPKFGLGDSGGGSFQWALQPAGQRIAAVHTGGHCNHAVSRDTPIHEHRAWITRTIGKWSRDESMSFSRALLLFDFEYWFTSPGRGTANWVVRNGQLREDSNAHTRKPGFTWGPTLIDWDQSVFNGTVEVSTGVTTDNDVQGLVQRARNQQNYYQFAAREEGGWARIDRRTRWGDRRLAEVDSNVDWRFTHRLRFLAFDDILVGFMDGTPVIFARDTAINAFTAGSVGIMEHGQERARFDDYRVTHVR